LISVAFQLRDDALTAFEIKVRLSLAEVQIVNRPGFAGGSNT